MFYWNKIRSNLRVVLCLKFLLFTKKLHEFNLNSATKEWCNINRTLLFGDNLFEEFFYHEIFSNSNQKVRWTVIWLWLMTFNQRFSFGKINLSLWPQILLRMFITCCFNVCLQLAISLGFYFTIDFSYVLFYMYYVYFCFMFF